MAITSFKSLNYSIKKTKRNSSKNWARPKQTSQWYDNFYGTQCSRDLIGVKFRENFARNSEFSYSESSIKIMYITI